MSEPVEFLASIAPLDSAIQVSSHGGARVKIDIPESEMPSIVRLLLLRGQTLQVTVEPAIGLINENGRTQRKSKQSAWTTAEESSADSPT